MLNDYMELFLPGYGIVMRGDDDEQPSRRAPYGGHVHYRVTTRYEKKDVSTACMDRDDTLYFILDSMSSVSAKDVLLYVLGFVPFLSEGFSIAQGIQAYLDSETARSIRDNGGRAKLVSIYNRVTQVKSTVLKPWYTYPWMYTEGNYPTNVRFDVFNAHNPFN